MVKKRKQEEVEEEELTEEELALDEEHEEAADDVEIEMYRVAPEAPRIRALLYSEPGAGKTTLAASAEDHQEMAPVLFANIEGGLLSVAHRKDIHAVDIENTDGLYALYRKIKNGVTPFSDINTLIIDSMTELQTQNLDEIVQEAMTSGKAKDRNRESRDEIWQEDYGVSTVQLARLIRWFRGLDINLILTAHAKFVYPPQPKNARRQAELVNTEPIAVLPMLTQKLCKTVMGIVDYVWYLEYKPEEDKRYMLTRPDEIRQAKTRGPRFQKLLGQVVEDPTMPMLYDTLVKSLSGKPSRKEK